jgi:3-methyladenine DNA glycosylase AlkD
MPSRSAPARDNSPSISDDVERILASLKRAGSERVRDDMQPRYGIVADKAFGVGMAAMQKIAKQSRNKDAARNHALAEALWQTGWYEARLIATMVDDAALVTPAQMDRWCRDFDNWAITDTACFKLFDRSPHAWKKVSKWSRARGEFQKRAASALLASMALHLKEADDEQFIASLPLIEAAATDDRNFVKKGVSWALRAMKRRGPKVKGAAKALAQRLAESSDATSRWIGKDAMKDLSKK